MKTVLILGATADIGRELGRRFARDNWRVAGTRRLGGTALGEEASGWTIVDCDLASAASIDAAGQAFRGLDLIWDLVVVAAGTEEPVGPFFECDADEWERGFAVNALAPLRFLRAIHPLRRRDGTPLVAFFSGSGTNNAAPSYSAYSASKLALIKMCELLDAESPDTGYFIVGPGIVRTKIHQQTLDRPAQSGANYRKVVDFLASGQLGTSHDDVYACLRWCLEVGKPVIGGRNLSLVHDAWRNGGSALASALKSDQDLYKLRRFGNDRRFPAPPV